MTRREDFEKWLDGEDFHGLCIDYRIASVEHTPDAFRDLRAGILTAALESQAGKPAGYRCLVNDLNGVEWYHWQEDYPTEDAHAYDDIQPVYLGSAESQAGKLTDAAEIEKWQLWHARLVIRMVEAGYPAFGRVEDAIAECIAERDRLRAIEAKTRE
jgi:hypothetical protein